MGMNKKVICVLLILGVAIGCVGCNNSEDKNSYSEEKSTEVKTTTRHITIPRTEKERREFLGTTDKNGKWIPPEGAHKDKHGNIVNKEGVTIGGPEHVVPDPNAVG